MEHSPLHPRNNGNAADPTSHISVDREDVTSSNTRTRVYAQYASHTEGKEIENLARDPVDRARGTGWRPTQRIRVHRRSRGITNEARRITAVSGVR